MLSMVLMVAAMTADEIEVRFSRPSRVLERLRTMLPPTHLVGVEADDRQGVLRLGGNLENRSRIRSTVALFDVRAGRVHVELRFYNPIERQGGEATQLLRNNQEWRLNDPGLATDFSVMGRINEDHSVTFVLARKDEAGEVKVTAQLRPRETLVWDGKRSQVFTPKQYGETSLPGVFHPEFYGSLPEGWRGGWLVALTHR